MQTIVDWFVAIPKEFELSVYKRPQYQLFNDLSPFFTANHRWWEPNCDGQSERI